MSNKPGSPEERMQALNTLADTQRARFLASLDVARSHAQPARIRERVSNRLLDRMLDMIARGRTSIMEHPARALGIAVLAGAVLARGSLLRLAAKAYTSGKAFAVQKYRQHHSVKESTITDG